MKIPFMRSFVTAAVTLTFCAAHSLAAAAEIEPPTLENALRAPGAVVFQPYQMKLGQTLLVTHTSFGSRPTTSRVGKLTGAMLVIYSTDSADYGHILYQDIFIPASTTGGPHVKVFDGFTSQFEQKGIIAVLIGLLLPADQSSATWTRLPSADAISAEIHDDDGVGLLLPAVQKVREAAARL